MVPIAGKTYLRMLRILATYYYSLIEFSFFKKKLEDSCLYRSDPYSSIWLYSLVHTIRLYNKKHYRSPTLGADIRANLRNLAIPASGIPMHLFFQNVFSASFFIIFIYPFAALVASAILSMYLKSPISTLFHEHLLQPSHWFARWRLNCFLVAWHAMLNEEDEGVMGQYSLEGKGEFLRAAEAAGDIPISPFRTDIGTLFAKHTHIEGGMGIHVLRNFTQGGDWILQDALTNDAALSRLLPPHTPLSTLRVVTGSRHWLASSRSTHPRNIVNATATPLVDSVSVFTVVLRAGRAGASTDHNSICFPVDSTSGQLGLGRSNQHWYKLGTQNTFKVHDVFLKTWPGHPDGVGLIEGQEIPGIQSICDLCRRSHSKLLPEVPLVGWDVALTAELGPVILELNISCNFFLGEVDTAMYLKFMQDFVKAMQRHETGQA
ncbi:hypothetical protein CEUSTIGMA_g1193.t1 [Chlamydomonas eustigma]|uniref:Alpha-L-glutamate ligase-related protein ATP-grasp domain-containing protein n=1 Tax=Chlamydomonas eustigma TaxID=1157962 RepID=A0A250WT87_9CHLO|nr:hypothetical protein CEUSTIGMA_g1193.t1 [Chlamydomonas eustigma]|eukprot:GAX73740.1 hypothetical protein CEUSTIGMA_g1193.t1 [Chlamydomonas eustigma]